MKRKREFKVGDKVVFKLRQATDDPKVGRPGVVIEAADQASLLVDFGKGFSGHGLNGTRWYVEAGQVKHVPVPRHKKRAVRR